ncbi:TlpA family protein disulfide reductase [Aquibacillus sp. 3ASR75-11]|uniref:TlpA family protein disulfide reductase n=1 Tax=Terrihalobacillus insolitus TaxID=2950438 RepID=A0A9X3WPJ3_9BACI|nr:TlpA disulfide reductase family protein [Terrihalobacillus insolitus]MDC3412761.1 TlpA family protein disulfide reductase [Terrihalobacillus insolitus]MDC3423762.1 TlpA family protein disulfide reductase [Terrihalobacillus insolitus]
MKLRDEMPELLGESEWLNGSEIRKEALIGNKPTLIHFWSVSCELCKEAMPKVNEFRDEYEKELNVLAVHIPRSEKDLDLDKIKEIAKQYDISQTIFVDNDRKLNDAFDNKYVPSYYVFDVDGKLRHFQAGGGGMKMLRKRVNRVLGKT